MIKKICEAIIGYAEYHGYDDLHYQNIDFSLIDDENNIIIFKLQGSKFDPFIESEEPEEPDP